MKLPSVGLVLVGVLTATALVAPDAATSSALSPRDVTCPLSSFPATAAESTGWLTPTYQQAHSPDELAHIVLACEVKFKTASQAVAAELALISLNPISNSFQNLNMFLSDSRGALTPDYDFYNLGIPPMSLEDGPDGIVYRAPSGQYMPMTYPNELALSASMDPFLAQQYGQELGLEATTLHFQGVQAPDLNLARIPNWGRIQETFGEDSFLAGALGSAETVGILKNAHIAVLKHFGVYGQETNRKSANFLIGSSALHDTYLRPFSMATNTVATSAQVPAQRQVAIMCSYGNVNGVRACINPQLATALTQLPYSGLVRTDLNTITPSTSLLASAVSMIKPLDSTQFQPYGTISSAVRTNLDSAAIVVLRTMFAAGLVNASQWSVNSVGSLTPTVANAGLALAYSIEERSAVLLKNTYSGQSGMLPIVKRQGPFVIVAPTSLSNTCASLAKWLATDMSAVVKCALWNQLATPATNLFTKLPNATGGHTLVSNTKWIAPTTGAYLIKTSTFGNSSLSMNGATLQNEPGITQYYAPNYSTVQVTLGQSVSFQLTYSSDAPTVTIAPLAPSEAVAASDVVGSKTAIVLANDGAVEGMDRDQIGSPFGQDSIIATVAARIPTSVALMTTGPVTMPWLPSVKSVLEMWNPVGYAPVDNVAVEYVPAYGALLDGTVSPSGRLPVTFPASQNSSPMSITLNSHRFDFWPGVASTANLALAPINGTEIGYGWYHQQRWPVLFPFGFGLSYATMSSAFFLTTNCAGTDSSTSICFLVNTKLVNNVNRAARQAVQLYVAQPSTVSAPRPTLVLGAVASVLCRSATALTGLCTSGVHLPVKVTALGVGAWSDTTHSYQFVPGCYNFVVASSSASAYNALATPSLYPGAVAHASTPFSPSTVISPGVCP